MDKLHQITAFFIGCIVALSSYAQLNLEDIFLKGKYYPKSIPDVAFLHKTDKYAILQPAKNGQQIVIYNTQAKSVDSLELYKYWTDKDMPQPRFQSVEISNTDAYFLLKANEEKLYRRAGAANYFITDKDGVIGQVGTGKYSFPQFSPDDKKLACVKYNNLYWFDMDDGIEQSITTDGKWNSIINGKSDWVYEEELELTRAFEWSPNSTQIAYLKFDETNVKEFQMPVYLGQVYPTNFLYKYPKVGEENSKVSVWVYDLQKNKNIQVKLNDYNFEYIPRIYWNATGTEVWIMLLNRYQDTLRVMAYDVNSKKTRTVYEEYADTYVDVPFAFDILNDNSFIINSEKDGWNHLYHYDANGKLINQLTKGNFEVTTYYGSDEKSKTSYYQSNENYTPGRKIYSVQYETMQVKCLTPEAGTNTVLFSPSFNYFIHTYNSAVSPNTTKIVTADLSHAILIEDNATLRLQTVSFPKKEFIKISVNDTELDAWVLKPDSLDPSKKYPLLMFVYGGPHHQEVLDKGGSNGDRWYEYLVQQGYIVASVDNRGTSGKSAAFEKCIYTKLGKMETEDQIAAAKYFSTLSFIDSSRIAIYGASYGGYIAAMCLLKGNGVFNSAIAQSPISDWKFYDNIYTERYMRKPEDNMKGYEQSNLLNYAHLLQGNLLLIHGISDDNVHFQHSIEFIRALNDAHKDYDLYIYPDKNHGISGGETRYDLYRKVTKFLLDKL